MRNKANPNAAVAWSELSDLARVDSAAARRQCGTPAANGNGVLCGITGRLADLGHSSGCHTGPVWNRQAVVACTEH